MRRGRRQLRERVADPVLADGRRQRVVQVDVTRGGVPLRIDVLGVDGAAAQIPRVAQIRVGRAQIEIDGLLGSQRCFPRRIELVDVVVGRLEPVLAGGAQRANQPVGLRARALAVAPHQPIAVLLVEALLFPPQLVPAFAIVGQGKRWRLCVHRRSYSRGDVGGEGSCGRSAGSNRDEAEKRQSSRGTMDEHR